MRRAIADPNASAADAGATGATGDAGSATGDTGGTRPARRLISSGSSFELLAGYSRAVVDGEWVFVSGTTGFDYDSMTIAEDVVAQTHQCFANLAGALGQAGCTLDDVVRVRYLLVQAADFERVAPIFGQYLGRARPAATAAVVGLIDPRMRIEIEVTARRAGGTG